MKTMAKVITQGTSLVIPLTKQLKALGLKAGDWVEVTLEVPDRTEFVEAQGFDPSKVGDMILKTLDLYPKELSDDEIRSLARTYDRDVKHVEFILSYVKEARSKNRT